MPRRLATTALLLTLFAASTADVHADDVKPNFVLIFCDDLGWADVGAYGAVGYETPHLDRMAAEGVRFTDFYVSQAVCSASRAALMTGCYNARVGIFGALGPKSNIGINPDEETIAEVLKSAGYATACYGKWHLGHHEKFLPMQHGFDDYFGLPYSNDMWPYHPGVAHLPMEERLKRWPHLSLIDENEIVNPKVTPEDQTQLTTWYTERAVKFIEEHADEPFFVYLPHSMPHVPLYVSDKFKGKTRRGLFGDVIAEIDWSVGQILETLKRLDLDENTLVVFTSDNGPWLSYGDHAGSAGPHREGKGTMWDGGCREPFLARWPGRIPAGKVQREMASTIDVLPTFAKLAGAKLPEKPIDGKDVWPLLACEKGATTPHEAYWMYYGRQLQAVRSGKWKLHFPHGYRSMLGRPGGTGGKPTNYSQLTTGLALYDLSEGTGEWNDVKDAHPDVVERLKKYGEEAREALGDNGRPGKENRPPGSL